MVRHDGSANTATLQTPPDLCPSEEQLIAFGLQSLPAESQATISTHVSNCPRCELRLSAIVEKRSRLSAAGTVHESADNLLGPVKVAAGGDPSERLAAPADELTAPLRLGNYRLCERLGRGGMGVVYRAVHELLKREVAIKLLPLERVADKQGISRLKREMEAVGNVQHEHVVYATDAGESAGVYYLVMQLIDGLDVGRLLQRTGPLSPADACEIIRQAALGLDHIYSRQLVHRDLKPSNLMLTLEGVVKIMDLGLARLRKEFCGNDELTSDKYVLGTADYVAPEQAKDARHADVRSDIYSLGCTLFKLLAGRPPFSGEEYDTFTKKVLAHHGTPAPPIEDLRSDVSPEVAAVLAKMLAKSPDDRYQTPNDLGLAIAPFSAGADLRSLISSGPMPQPVTSIEIERQHSHDSEGRAEQETSGFEKTPTSLVARRPIARSLVSPRGGIMASIVLLALAGGAYYAAIGRNRASSNPSAAAAGDLLGSATEIMWPGKMGFTRVNIDRSNDMLEATADSKQLIELGTLKPGAQKIAVDVHITDDDGWAGLFFGYRTEIIHGRSQARFQVLHFQPASKSTKPPVVRFIRESTHLKDANASLLAWKEREVRLPGTIKKMFHVEVEFTMAGLAKVSIDGVDYPQLVDINGANAAFDPQECWGRWGLFNRGPTTRFFHITKRDF